MSSLFKLADAMRLSAGLAVGMRLLARVEAMVERVRPDLSPVQRQAIAAQLALESTDGVADTLDKLADRRRYWLAVLHAIVDQIEAPAVCTCGRPGGRHARRCPEWHPVGNRSNPATAAYRTRERAEQVDVSAPLPGACELCVCDDMDVDACPCCHTAPCQVTDPSAPLLVTPERRWRCPGCGESHGGVCRGCGQRHPACTCKTGP